MDALEFHPLEEFGSSVGIDVQSVINAAISGDLQFMPEIFLKLFQQALSNLIADFRLVFASLVLPMLALLLLRLCIGKQSLSQHTIRFICRASVVSALTSVFTRLCSTTQEMIDVLLQCSDRLSPVMFTAVILTGAENTAVILTPMAGVCANLIQNILGRWGIALSVAAAGIAVAGNISDSIRLKHLQGLFKRVLNWMAGILMAGFLAVLTLQGRIGGGRDSAAVRTARYAIESVVPIIGGNVSDSLDSLLSTAMIVKNAVGTTGLLLLVAICVAPVLRLTGMSFLLRLLSAIIEPFGDDGIIAMTSQFADAVEMLSVTIIAALVLCAMLIGSFLWAAGNIVR